MRMIEVLRDAIKELPGLLADGEWRSVHVTYHPPRVERLWIQLGDHRLLLHRIYPCEKGEALFHPHPWPSAVRVVSGHYEHRIGFTGHADGNKDFPLSIELCRTILVPGAEYEMVHSETWHSVRPLDYHADSIMLVGPLYDPPVEMPSPPTAKQGPLSPERFAELLGEWRGRYC